MGTTIWYSPAFDQPADGTKFQGAAGLKQMLLQSDRFVPTLTEKLMTYAIGRGL